MASAVPFRILLCANDPATVADLRPLLEGAGHTVSWHSLAEADPEGLPTYHLVVLDGSGALPEALKFSRRLRTRLVDGFLPLLAVSGDPAPDTRLASLQGGADTFLLRPFTPAELLAQIQAFLRIKEMHDRLTEKTAEVNRVNKRLQQAYQQIDQELELAGRIQQSFLPSSMPAVPRTRFAVYYQPCGRVGGDFYDVFRLDESHVGFYVADVMGHGVPASLLTIFLKQGVKAKEISGQQYRLVPPNEVLQRLNHNLIDQRLADNPFITMVYGLYNCQEGTLTFARAGHPHPLHLRDEEAPQLLQVRGSLLGVFETEFPVRTQQLLAGDKVLVYTDGTDCVSFESHPPGLESLKACAVRHRSLPIQDFVERLSADLLREADQPDDFTLLGLEVTG